MPRGGLPSRLTAAEIAVLRGWAARPSDDGGMVRVALTEVEGRLGRAPLLYRELLGPARWLAGGRVLRWLSGEKPPGGDVDLFFPSCSALNATLASLCSAGFRFQGFRAWVHDVCFRCGDPAGPAPRRRLPLLRQRRIFPSLCRKCGDFPAGETATPLPLTPELIAREVIAAVELISPEGDVFQLSTTFGLTPARVIERIDFSICQLAVDGETLHAHPRALEDLAARRLRIAYVNYPPVTLRRIAKYVRRGFRPSPRTVLAAIEAYWMYRRGGDEWRAALATRLLNGSERR